MVALEPLPSYGNHMTWARFAELVADGSLIDYDGTGVLATATQASEISILPTQVAADRPAWATHVVWFNK